MNISIGRAIHRNAEVVVCSECHRSTRDVVIVNRDGVHGLVCPRCAEELEMALEDTNWNGHFLTDAV